MDNPRQIAALEQEAAAQRKADRQWDARAQEMESRAPRQEAPAGRGRVAGQGDRSSSGPVDLRAFGAGSAEDQVQSGRDAERDRGGRDDQRAGPAGGSERRREVRASAIESLKKREPRDYVGLLIEMVQIPVEYKVQPVQGPGSQGGLLIDTPRFTMLRTYDAPPAFNLAATFRGTVTL